MKVLILILMWLSATPAAGRDRPLVIILSSYHPGFEWSDSEICGFQDKLRESHPDIDSRIEYLDAKRHPDLKNLEQVKEFLLGKYGEESIQLVVALDNPALDMLLRYRNELFSEVPIVFAGINGFDSTKLAGFRRVTGIVQLLDTRGTLETALALHPQTKEVLLVSDYTITGLATRQEAEPLVGLFEERVRIRFLPPATFEEAAAEMRALPPDSLVVLLSYATDRLGKSLSLAQSTAFLSSNARAPVYGVHETRLGHGIVGGLLLDGKSHGERAADMALRILAGEDPQTIPPDAQSTGRPMFDYAQLKRFSIPLHDLPTDSFVLNKPVSLLESHRRLVLGTLAVLVILIVLVIFLALSVMRRRRAEEALRESEYLLRKSQEIARLGSYCVDTRTGEGRSSETLKELLGVDESYPENVEGWIAIVHPEQREELLEYLNEHVFSQHNPFEKEYRIIRQNDGEERWIHGTGELEFDESGRAIRMIGTIQDITERKRAEEALRKSQRLLDEAQRLTHIGSWEILLKTQEIMCSDEIFRLFGLSPQELPQTLQNFFDRVHPDDLERVSRHYQETVETRTFKSYHYRIVKQDGSVRWIHATGAVECDSAGSPVGIVGTLQDITERRHIEEALRENEERLRLALMASNQGLYDLNTRTGKALVSPEYATMLGYDPTENRESVDRLLDRLHPDDRRHVTETYRSYIRGEIPIYSVEFRQRTRSGDWKWILSKGKIVARDTDGTPLRMIGTHTDITEKKHAEEERAKLESQLIQAQKMESIGRLAGGIAHDFNNMLSVILGYAELIKCRLDFDHPILESVLEIEKAATQSRDITRQLLAFSRKQIIVPRSLKLNEHIVQTQKTLARLLGEDINLHFHPGEDLWMIKLDPSQLDQILMNLAVNARDAMPEGGRLRIETANVLVDEVKCYEHCFSTPGECVLLEVSDEGIGMDEETLKHIFEPFFTTKELGRGTGLGLATVYGIVNQNHGLIDVQSKLGEGTAFRIYFPRTTVEDLPEEREEAPISSGSGRVLLVEDDELVRGLIAEVLEAIGYTVLAVETSHQALALCENRHIDIDLLITDVVMPEMSGVELAERIAAMRPGVHVLFMSGYRANTISDQGILKEGFHFIQKPFSMRDIATKINEVTSRRAMEDVPKPTYAE